MAGVSRRQIRYLDEAPAKSEAFMLGVGNKKWVFTILKIQIIIVGKQNFCRTFIHACIT